MKNPAKSLLMLIGRIVGIPVLVIALPLMFFLPRIGLMALKIDVTGGDRCWNVPDKARNIYAKGSHLRFAAEFEIAEEDFVDYCRKRRWNLIEIVDPVNVATYRGYVDSGVQPTEVTIAQGLFHDGMTSRGGFVAAFDRTTGKGFIEYSHN